MKMVDFIDVDMEDGKLQHEKNVTLPIPAVPKLFFLRCLFLDSINPRCPVNNMKDRTKKNTY
jgi:hypothetical protein